MFLNLREVEAFARERVPVFAYDYVAGASGDERTLRANLEGWSRYRLVHRVLRGVAKRDASTTVLGEPVALPALVAPTAFHKLMHPEGEAATARGAATAGTLCIASTLSTTSLEDIARASTGPKWFQLYVYQDRALTRALVERAVAAGYRALVLTVDTPILGRRERDVRNEFALPPGMGLANFADVERRLVPGRHGASGLAAYTTAQLDASLTWADVAWLRDISGLPVVVKGVVHPDDARLAIQHGAAGIVVSNHGGRQLDAGISTVEALADVVAAAGGRAEVYVDGGVRRGTDILVALALGARAVLVGRPILWALALGGAEGVAQALRTLAAEFDEAMALAGVRSPREVTRDLVRPAPHG